MREPTKEDYDLAHFLRYVAKTALVDIVKVANVPGNLGVSPVLALAMAFNDARAKDVPDYKPKE